MDFDYFPHSIFQFLSDQISDIFIDFILDLNPSWIDSPALIFRIDWSEPFTDISIISWDRCLSVKSFQIAHRGASSQAPDHLELLLMIDCDDFPLPPVHQSEALRRFHRVRGCWDGAARSLMIFCCCHDFQDRLCWMMDYWSRHRLAAADMERSFSLGSQMQSRSR